jgi:Beta propeller domain
VEEADIVQSNGVQVFAVYGSEILELDASTSTLTRRIQVPPSGDCKDPINAMLLVGERLVVILSKYSYCANGPISDVMTTPATLPPEEMPIISTNDGTRVVIFDTTTGAALSDEVIRGYYANSRAIGSNVHIVTNTYFDVWRLLQFLDPYMLETEAGAKLNETEYQRLAEAELEKRLDVYANTLASELDCKGTQKISLLQNTDDDLSFSSNIESLVSITSFAATNPASNSTKNMLIPSGGLQVYSSAERLVLAIQGWWMSSSASQETYLVTYKYANATTVGSTLGSVPGYILNQFSMDHINQNDVDYLRVATSTQSIWAPNAEGIWENTANSTSQVSILQFNDGAAGAMPMVGKITDLGKPGEQIYSVRFIGDKGFVVTFLQTDPFYTLDLSDPTNPQVAGELEIPGYSSYLHPAGENAIIGVGQAADANGTITGLQISLFDVSDFSNPVRVQNLEVSSRNSSMSSGASSEAEYDHKALRYLPESKLLIIPVTYYEYTVVPCNYETDVPMPVSETVTTKQATASDEAVDSSMPIDRPWWPTECYNNTGGFDGFRVYKIDEVAGISQHFAIEHASGNDFAYGCWSSAFLQARSLVFEGELMTMKGHSILSNDLTTLQQIAAPIILDNEEEECHTWMY